MELNELTHKVIGCAMKVHRALGCGFREAIYQRALAIEMEKQAVRFSREIDMPVYYESIEIGTRRVDFFVGEHVLVELKAVAQLDEAHLAQAINYLEAFKLPTGLLVNFGARSLEFKRVYNSKNSIARSGLVTYTKL